MYVNVNPASMARAIQGFVKAAGGEASYSSALELVARMSGFDVYRAQKAYAETNAKKDDIVFETVLHAWDENNEQGKPSQVERRKDVYRLQVEKFGDQLRLSIVPDDVKDLMDSDGRNVLDVLLEINQGLPCLHMTNDPAREMLLTVFGHAGGLLVREDEGELEEPRDANEKLTAHMVDEDWHTPGSRDDAYVINRDTKELRADDDPQPEETPAPVKQRYEVKAAFEDYTAPNFGRLAFNVVVFDTVDATAPREGWQVFVQSPFYTDFTEKERTNFCEGLCLAFSKMFNRRGSTGGCADMNLLQLCLQGGASLVRRLAEVADQHPNASFEELEKLYRMTAAVWTSVKNRK
jgi:hypothetical protein